MTGTGGVWHCCSRRLPRCFSARRTLFPALDDWPIYQFLIVCCLVVVCPLSPGNWPTGGWGSKRSPRVCWYSCCPWLSRTSPTDSSGRPACRCMKSANCWLLSVDCRTRQYASRLTLFVQWLTVAITVVAGSALLDRAGLISVAALEPVQSHGGAGGSQNRPHRANPRDRHLSGPQRFRVDSGHRTDIQRIILPQTPRRLASLPLAGCQAWHCWQRWC